MPFITQWKEKPLDESADGSNRRIEKGAVENARTSLLNVLEERFGDVPGAVLSRIDSIENPTRLTTLMRLAVRVPAMKEFVKELEK